MHIFIKNIWIIVSTIICVLTSYYASKWRRTDEPGRVAQSVGHLTRKSEVLGSIPGLATYFRFSFRWFTRGSCQLLAKVCARSTGSNRLGGLSLPRKSVVRLTDRPDMTLDVYRGRKTTTQQQQQQSYWRVIRCLKRTSVDVLFKLISGHC